MQASYLVVANRNEIEHVKGNWTSLKEGLKALKERSGLHCDMISEAVGRVLVAQTQSGLDDATSQLRTLLLAGVGLDRDIDDCKRPHVPPATCTTSLHQPILGVAWSARRMALSRCCVSVVTDFNNSTKWDESHLMLSLFASNVKARSRWQP